MQNAPIVVIAEPARDRARVSREIEQVHVSHGGADLRASLDATRRLIEQVSRTRVPRERIQVCFFTDLGRTTWQDASQPACHAMFAQLAAKANLSLTDVGQDAGLNFAVTNLRADKSLVTTGESVRLEAEVQAFGATQPAEIRLQFLADGHVIDEQLVSVPARGKATAVADIRLHTAGDHAMEARLATDSLDVDNQRWMIVPVRKSLQILCVQGEPDAADYVALALNPDKSVESSVRAEVVAESAILDRHLTDVDCVILNNVARISPDEAGLLQRFVTGGGGLVTVLGDRVQADSYNRQLGEDAKERRVLPARLEQVVRDGERFFDPREYQHPVIAPFRGHERAGLLTVPTWRYFKLHVSSPTAKIALAFDNGDPAIVEEEIGSGRSLLVATALSPSSADQTADGIVPWCALPAWPSFPPVVHGLMRTAIQGRESNRTVTVQSPLVVATSSSTARSATVTLPDESTRRVACTADAGGSRCAFDTTVSKGVYRMRLDAPGEPPRLFAVNVDPLESDLARVEANTLPDELQPRAIDGSVRNPAAAPDGVKLFRILLGTVAILMLTESVLACRFARRMA